MYYIHDLDPVAFSILGWPIYWYGLSYLVGFGLGLWWVPRILEKVLKKHASAFPRETQENIKTKLIREKLENFLILSFLIGVLGGRLGHFLFYYPEAIWHTPSALFMVWEGGMSIHGGILATVIFIFFWAKKNKLPFLLLTDILVIPLCIGLALGRIANFINGELIGVPTDQTWGVMFPFIDEMWRHPSPLYESLRNLFLARILGFFFWKNFYKIPGFLSGIFLVGYGVLRTFTALWREPTVLFFDTISIGQILSLGMVVVGVLILWKNRKFSIT
jgi:phosphatidylglycerol:prolipoprotein diacylglycerol transferase